MSATILYSRAWYQDKKEQLNAIANNVPPDTNCYSTASQQIPDLPFDTKLSRWVSCRLAALAMNINPLQNFDTYRTASYVSDNLRQIVENTIETGWQDCTATSLDIVTFADLPYDLPWNCTQAPFITGGGPSWEPVGLSFAKEMRDIAIAAIYDWQWYNYGYEQEAERATRAEAADIAVALAAMAQKAVYNAPDPRWVNVFDYIPSYAQTSTDRDFYMWDGPAESQLFRWVFKLVGALTTYKMYSSSYTQWRYWDEGVSGWNIYPRYWNSSFFQNNIFEFGSGPSGQMFFLGDIPLVRLLMGITDVPPTCTGRGPPVNGEANTVLSGISSYDTHWFEES